MSEAATTSSQRRLGRGLSALLGGGAPAYEESQQEIQSELRNISTSELTRNPFQPRKQFDPEAIGELASSIKEHGILQPLLVRSVDNGYQIIAGERRWQAAQKAGVTSIPCRVVDVVDKTACEFALEENLKRKDLNDLEKAEAFRDYIAQFQCSIEELSKQLSMKRSTVSNMLRLLDLPDPVKNALNSGRLSAGHARAILPLPQAQQLELSSRIQAEQLSVRQTEATVKKMLGREPEVEAATAASTEQPTDVQQQAPVSEAESRHPQQHGEEHQQAQHIEEASNQHAETLPMHQEDPNRTHHVASLESQLRDLLGVPVEIKLNSKESGQIVVQFANNQEFERILGTLRRNAA
ncbi:ParB/RepB/Spo0J family partition protein [Planctomicrobium sp. SH661]|uniref:ParB/RepB/Spo0J family partition protein n=1 Tax=Planctomicrobium sp. SH661 TaxID=3448124 RepID=UPI003F5BDCC4